MRGERFRIRWLGVASLGLVLFGLTMASVILENLRTLAVRAPGRLTVRVPIVPGCTDGPENLRAIAVFISSIGIRKVQVQRSFIAVNNQLVLAEARLVSPHKLLILLPQCLQNHDCGVRITGNVENCKACGKCKIKSLVELSKRYEVSMAVATGGTLARRLF